jgi:hypothetical protein
VSPGVGNPLGIAALYLNKVTYLLHGTSDDWQVGMSETDGCIELRNSDVRKLYSHVSIGETVKILKQGPFFAFDRGKLYVEAGPYFEKNSVARLTKDEARLKAAEFIDVTKNSLEGKNSGHIHIDRVALELALELGVGYPVSVGYIK